jgi:branched-chain amino acid transport system substrate-binding protein
MRTGPMPYYVGFASDPRVLEPFSKYIFSGAAMPVASVVSNMVDFLANKLKAKTAAILSCDQANCKVSVPLLKKGLDEKGVKLVEDQTFHSGDTDFTAQINAIKAANPDVVQMWGLPADGGRIVAQLRRAGITATVVGDTAMADQTVLDFGGPAAEGMYAMWIAGAQFLSDDTGPMKEFHERFAKMFPNPPAGMPNQYTIRAYADAYVIAEAIRRAGSDISQENIVKQLDTIQDFVAGKDENFKYAAAIGLPRSFSPTDHQGTKVLTPVVVKDGKFQNISQ